VAAIVLGTGATLALMWFLFGGLPISNHAAYGNVPVPGSASLPFPAGQVMISFEEDGIFGENDAADMPSDLAVTVLSPAGGVVPIERLSENLFAINIEGTGRVPYGQISVPAAGAYQVAATANEVTSAVSPRVTFGEPPLNPFGPTWLGALLILAPFALVALVLILPLRR
jgi:hypothetical protein